MSDPCAVCGLSFQNSSNRLLNCGNCSLAVHQGCYGVQKSAGLANWFCRKCESQVRMSKIRCDLCPIKDGAFKRSSGARCGWAHLLCAFYISEVSFEDPVSMDLILVDNVPSDRFGRSCVFCERNQRSSQANYGACIQCAWKTCRTYFHVTCAAASGLLTDLPSTEASATLSLASVLQSTRQKSPASTKSSAEVQQPATRNSNNRSGHGTVLVLRGFCSQRHKEKFSTDCPASDNPAPIVSNETNATGNSPERTSDSLTDFAEGRTVDSHAVGQRRRTLPHRSARYVNPSAVPSTNSSTSDLQLDGDGVSENSGSGARTSPVPPPSSSSDEVAGDVKPKDEAEQNRTTTATTTVGCKTRATGLNKNLPEQEKSDPGDVPVRRQRDKGDRGKVSIDSQPQNNSVQSPVHTTTDQSPTVAAEKLEDPGAVSLPTLLGCDAAETPVSLLQSDVNGTNGDLSTTDPTNVDENMLPPKLELAPRTTTTLGVVVSRSSPPVMLNGDNNTKSETASPVLDPAQASTEVENTTPITVTASERPSGHKRHAKSRDGACRKRHRAKSTSSSKDSNNALQQPLSDAATPAGSTARTTARDQQNLTLVLPHRSLSLRGLGLPCTSKNNTVFGPLAADMLAGPRTTKAPGSASVGGPVAGDGTRGVVTTNTAGQPPLATMHDLLEWQWDQGGTLLMQQAEGTDVVSLLDCLHQLKSENDILEAKLVRLQTRREHLRSVNARLSASLATMEATRMGTSPPSPPLSTITVSSAEMKNPVSAVTAAPSPSQVSPGGLGVPSTRPIAHNYPKHQHQHHNHYQQQLHTSETTATQSHSAPQLPPPPPPPPPILSPNKPCPKHSNAVSTHQHHHPYQTHAEPVSAPLCTRNSLGVTPTAVTSRSYQNSGPAGNMVNNWRPIAPAPADADQRLGSRLGDCVTATPVNPSPPTTWNRSYQSTTEGITGSSPQLRYSASPYYTVSQSLPPLPIHQSADCSSRPGKRANPTSTQRAAKHASPRRWPFFQPATAGMDVGSVGVSTAASGIGSGSGGGGGSTVESNPSRSNVDLNDLQELSARLSSAIAARQPLNVTCHSTLITNSSEARSNQDFNTARSIQAPTCSAGTYKAPRSLISHVPDIQPKPAATTHLPAPSAPGYSVWTNLEPRSAANGTYSIAPVGSMVSTSTGLLAPSSAATAVSPATTFATSGSSYFVPSMQNQSVSPTDRSYATAPTSSFGSALSPTLCAPISRAVDMDRSVGFSQQPETSNPNVYGGSSAAAAYLVLTPTGSAHSAHPSFPPSGQSLPSAGTLLDRSACPPSS